MNQVIDVKRLGYLGRSYMLHNWRGLLISGAAVSGVIFILVFLQALFTRRVQMDYSSAAMGVMAVWGCINASMAFSALHDKNQNEAYLLLPASALEKVSIKILFGSAVLPIGILFLVTLASIISEAVAGLLFGTGFNPLNPFMGIHFKAWAYVVIGQSIFFLGSAWFKKAHFIKTVLALIIGFMALGFLGGVLFRVIYSSYFDTFWDMRAVDIDIETILMARYPRLGEFMETTAKTIFYALLTPFCWFTAWLRVKETQSSDGI